MSDNQVEKIVRVDMKETPKGVVVAQYSEGWTARTSPVEIHVNTTTSLAEMIEWFKKHGWTVREWPHGARAFLGKAMPVRSKWQIINLRHELTNQMILAGGHHWLGEIHAFDLAVDL